MAEEIKAEEAAAKEPKKGKKKWPIIAGVVAVVLVAAGAGMWVWHEQPSFCGAICHTPMDAYYATYDTGDQDKYGNEMTDEAQKTAMAAYNHKNVAQAACMDCHEPVITQQIGEGMNWITGAYEIEGTNGLGQAVLTERTVEELAEGVGMEASEDFCLKSGCHATIDGRDGLVEATADLSQTRNPHLSQHAENDCGTCHKAHAQSVNQCSQCHSDAPIPEGWLNAADAKQLQTVAA